MASVLDDPMTTEMTVGDLFDRFGPIPLWRIVFDPAPGTATFEDVISRYQRTGRFCELVDGVLVEKDMSYEASRIGYKLGWRIGRIAEEQNLGLVTGEQGFLRLTTGRVRGPDIAFVAWERFPGGYNPQKLVPDLAPTLAIEVISPGNTRREMDDKLVDYFHSGVELVWYVYPKRSEVEVYTGIEEKLVLGIEDTLDGGSIVPGFSLPLAELFAKPSAGKSDSPEEE